ncbi:MAG: hypothetical protein IH623_31780 [Verrucomicrobia bacterium]|nr:hypothetical protein [Verrucomicrobiota bacterium]
MIGSNGSKAPERAYGIVPEDHFELRAKVSSAGTMHGSMLTPGCTGTLIWKYHASSPAILKG